MPRQARSLSRTGYSHVIVRGIGKQILFEERDDYTFFLSILKKYSVETAVSVCAYCLMENHVHLLLLDKKGQLAPMMKKLGVAYARYFNEKYERTGHLFQDRYLSEPVDTDMYFIGVSRYILQNPEKAGICLTQDYEWSSYKDYGKKDSFVDTSLLEAMIGDWDDYEFFMGIDDNKQYLEFQHYSHDDEWAQAIISEVLGSSSGTVIQTFEKSKRDAAICALRARGITVRQLERLTGITRGVIQKASR